MRSEHPSLLRWSLRPGPTGLRRLAAGYLVAAAGTLVALLILGITVLVSRHCQVGGGMGFGCLSWYFRGLGLAVLGGLAATLAVSIVVKLGFRFVLSLLAVVAPVLLIVRLLQIAGLDATPYAIAALAGAPALASWLSDRKVLPDPVRPSDEMELPTSPVGASAGPARPVG